MRQGERIRLRIERLSSGGEGVARTEGRVVFVPYAAPGDTLEAQITDLRKRFARARILKITESSGARVDPPCPYHFRVPGSSSVISGSSSVVPGLWCGGCSWQHLPYPSQLEAKRAIVQETLERLGGLSGITVKPVLGMKDPWRYRNKVQQPVGWNGQALISGFYSEGSHDIVPVEDCLVQSELSVKIIQRTLELFKKLGVHAYDPKRHLGWIRHLLLRTSQDGKAMLILVTRDPSFAKEREIIPVLIRECPNLVAIHQNIQPARTNVILGSQWRKIHGQDYLEERLGRLRFRLSPGAFFQVNSPQAEILYNVIQGMAGRGERLLDLYTGVGTIALWLADGFQEVGGVEEFPAAFRDAEMNAELNNIDNARFIAKSAEAFLGGLAHDRRPLAVVVDPPRSGCTPSVLKSLVALRPSPLVYVSCDPATLARDLGVLTKGGYWAQEIQPVDLFPHTPHIETAVKLTFK